MSTYDQLVVARHADGRTVRGTTSDFRPGRTLFHVLPEDGDEAVRVLVADLKALFYVKTLFGDHAHEETNSFRYRKGVGRRVWVVFRDGEEMAGWAPAYAPEKGGFFLFPTDAQANAEKAFIVLSAVRDVFLDDAAERAADRYESRRGKSPNSRRGVRRVRQAEWDHMLGIQPSPPGPPTRRSSSSRPNSGLFLQDW
jgi:hypothetical protein